MSIASGTRLGPYQIVSPLGAGGMGEVYRARDVRLQRDVAIKVLPEMFAADPDRLERFEQEARAAAALNHANIVAVFDFGEHEGAPFIVSELLEGQTLRAWLDDGPMPPRKAIELATQIATGLAAAHDKGIVHRDLKPENVFVQTGGHAKILDFGLAKLTQGEPAAIGLTSFPTTPPIAAAPKTIPGVVMGTVGYMAPEQVRGGAADHRADIFALGVVLYEMLAGRRPFTGETNADVMSAILRVDPPAFDDRTTVPASLVRVVSRCLEKQPASRFQSASDLAFALQSAGSDTRSSGSAAAIPAELSRRRGGILAVTTAIVIAAALAALGAWKWWPVPAVTLSVRAELALPPNLQLGPHVALSPDGRQVVFTASQATTRLSADPAGSLWLRDLTTGKMRELPNTDRALTPFWSPEGSAIGFFADGALRVIDVSSGRIRVVCSAPGARTWGTWNSSGTIVFATETGQPLMRVEADGKTPPVPATKVYGLRPSFLPDGTHFVFAAGATAGGTGFAAELAIGELGRTDITLLHESGSEPHFIDGHLLFVRDESLVAQSFDVSQRRLVGPAVTIAELTGHQPNGVGTNIAAAGDLIVFTNMPRDERRLAWRSREGSPISIVEGDGSWVNPDLSPDGTRLAVSRSARDGTLSNIWTVDLARGGLRQVAATPAAEQIPFWSPDGQRILYYIQSGPNEEAGVYEKAPDGSGGRLLMRPGGNVSALTNDGLEIVGFRVTDGNRDIFFGPVDGSKPLAPFARGPGNETQPALSPDNRWLAYASDELGPTAARAVFVQAFPGGGPKVQVSTDHGGVQPRWRRDGKELLFVDDEGWITSAPVVSAEPLRFGTVSRLFKTDIPFQSGLGTRAFYDVTNDGTRFIVSEARQPTVAPSIELITNWKQLLTAKVAR